MHENDLVFKRSPLTKGRPTKKIQYSSNMNNNNNNNNKNNNRGLSIPQIKFAKKIGN